MQPLFVTFFLFLVFVFHFLKFMPALVRFFLIICLHTFRCLLLPVVLCGSIPWNKHRFPGACRGHRPCVFDHARIGGSTWVRKTDGLFGLLLGTCERDPIFLPGSNERPFSSQSDRFLIKFCQYFAMIAMVINNLKTNPRPLSNKFLWVESWLIRGWFLHKCHIIEDPWNVHWLFESCARSRVLHEKCLNALLRAHMLGFSELFFNGYRKIHRKTPYFMGKSMVSCRFSLSLKPIYWFLLWIGPWDLGGDLHISQTLLLRSFFDLTPNGQILNRLAEDETWQNKNPHLMQLLHMKDVYRQDTNILDYNLPQTTKPQKQLALHYFSVNLMAPTFATRWAWGYLG